MQEPENVSDLQRRRVAALRPLTATDCTDGIRKVGQAMRQADEQSERQRVLADYPGGGQSLPDDEEPWGAWRA